MNREEAIAKLESLPQFKDQSRADYEAAHIEADHVLRQLLIDLGYYDVVASWDKVGKFYS